MAERIVQCAKLNKEAPGIPVDDMQGRLALDMVESVGGESLRQRVHDQVSWEAWQMWVPHLTMLMNEYRLNPMDPKSDEIIRQQMEAFFFDEGNLLAGRG